VKYPALPSVVKLSGLRTVMNVVGMLKFVYLKFMYLFVTYSSKNILPAFVRFPSGFRQVSVRFPLVFC